MKLSRRKLLKASAASTLIPLSGCVSQTQNAALKQSGIDSKPASNVSTHAETSSEFDAVMHKATEVMLHSYPESATSAGIDNGKYANLKFQLSDRSINGQEKIKTAVNSTLQALQNVPDTQLNQQQSLDLNVVRNVFEMAKRGFDLPYGDMALLNSNWSYRNSPYAVAQNTGAFVEIPSFLDSSHSIKSNDDIDAYLERMKAYAKQLDGETERVLHDAEQGSILPDFLLQKTIDQLSGTLNNPSSKWGLVTSVINRGQGIGNYSTGQLSTSAIQVVDGLLRPAIKRQADALRSLAPKANSNAGVWALRDGDEYYKWALEAGTTTTMSPDDVHQMGLDELARLHSRMDPILRSVGYTKGSVGERMTALAADPRYHFAEGDAGRAEIMSFIDSTIEDVRKRMPQAFETLVPGFLEVTRIAPEVEAGAPGAYGGAGSIDGTKPGHFWINLRTPALHNKFSLADLTYHEAIPGHVWQGEYTFKQSLLRSLLAFNAYSEGWALYAEQIADELGVYGDYPVGQLGYLQSLAFRACRLVVDTGLHAKRWTREHANEWFVTNNGSNPEEVAGEVDRYCAWPGQACGYKVGHTTIVNLRQRAKNKLGDKFNYRRFNDSVVLGGAVPMTVLNDVIESYIERELQPHDLL